MCISSSTVINSLNINTSKYFPIQKLYRTMSHFRYTIARTNTEKELGYRLRYQVYVEEFGFERKEDCPNQMEIDKYDRHSIHILAWDQNELAGTCRIVLPSSLGLPGQEFPSGLRFPPDAVPDLRSTAEISRLTVKKSYRRLSRLPSEGSRFSELVISLIIAGMRVAMAMHVDWILFISEPKIVHLCCCFGFGAALIKAGEAVIFHKALRAPYVGAVKDLYEMTAWLHPTCHRQLFPAEVKESIPEASNQQPHPKGNSLDIFCFGSRGKKSLMMGKMASLL